MDREEECRVGPAKSSGPSSAQGPFNSSVLDDGRQDLIKHGRQSTHGLPPISCSCHSSSTRRLYTHINDWQSRVLLLQPGHSNDVLVADLLVIDLVHPNCAVLHKQQQKILYEAISYFWGEPSYRENILMNSESYPITDSAAQALRHFRLVAGARYLWLDALCIDQCNVEERSMQVANMLAIFARAERVLIWLGEQSNETRAVIDYIEEHGIRGWRRLHVDAKRSSATHYPHTYFDRSMLLMPEETKMRRLLKGLQDLLDRPWFRRVWVRQEVWAAQKLSISCGDVEFDDWYLLLEAADLATLYEDKLHMSKSKDRLPSRTYYDLLAAFTIPEERTRALVNVCDKYSQGFMAPLHGHMSSIDDQELQLVYLLHKSALSLAECSDARDHVYGLVGMSKTNILGKSLEESPLANGPELRIDYGKSASSIFQDVARYVMRRDYSLNVLYLMADFGGHVDGHPLPSWTPDWRKPISFSPWGILAESIWQQLGGSFQVEPHSITGSRAEKETSSSILQLLGSSIGSVSLQTDWPSHELSVSLCHWFCKTMYSEREHRGTGLWSKFSCISIELTKGSSTQVSSGREIRQSPREESPQVCGGDAPSVSARMHRTGDYATDAGLEEPCRRCGASAIWIASKDTRESDLVVMATGGRLPLLLRRRPNSEEFDFVGPALPITCASLPGCVTDRRASASADAMTRGSPEENTAGQFKAICAGASQYLERLFRPQAILKTKSALLKHSTVFRVS